MLQRDVSPCIVVDTSTSPVSRPYSLEMQANHDQPQGVLSAEVRPSAAVKGGLSSPAFCPPKNSAGRMYKLGGFWVGDKQRVKRSMRRRNDSKAQFTTDPLQSASRAGASAVVAALPPAGAEARSWPLLGAAVGTRVGMRAHSSLIRVP